MAHKGLKPHERELADSARRTQREKVFAAIASERRKAMDSLDISKGEDRIMMLMLSGLYGSLETAIKEALDE